MKHNLLTETVISLSQAARRLPPCRGDRPVCATTIWRWIGVGVKAMDGSTIKLEAVRIGARWVTSAEALSRFSERLTTMATGEQPTDDAAPTVPQVRTANQRRKASERAATKLEAAGV